VVAATASLTDHQQHDAAMITAEHTETEVIRSFFTISSH
jgi:hypothetical protein